TILKPIGYFDVTFYDWCVAAGGDITSRERAIHEVLFPSVEFLYNDFRARAGLPKEAPVDGKWRDMNESCVRAR
ncbi:MAG TPA: hypothetical protein VGB13_01245, partial [Candidatus Krumholzibacteria bacterium]